MCNSTPKVGEIMHKIVSDSSRNANHVGTLLLAYITSEHTPYIDKEENALENMYAIDHVNAMASTCHLHSCCFSLDSITM